MYDLSPLNIVLLVAAGVGSGFINTLAGGGSLLTLPALILLGMPADFANGTNRISVLAQSASTVMGFHGAGKFDTRAAVSILAPAAFGSLIGSLTATWIDPKLLEPLLLFAMLAMAAVLALRPKAIAPTEAVLNLTVKEKPIAIFYLFLVGLYGGFAQAGVGYLSLLVLGAVLRYDLVRANALKIAISGMFGIVPLAVFLLAGKVLWVPGAVLAVATIVGSRLGVRFALEARADTLRWILFACVVLACSVLLWRRFGPLVMG